jgi:sterol desaturase/sphingolipid hydroxylase (fatty acid hydroxylase superfamily)
MPTKRENNNQKGNTITMFKNPILERLSRTHVSIPISIFFLYASGLLYWSIENVLLSVGTAVSLFFIGWLSFTLVEYLAHRYVFHMSVHNKLRKKLQYAFHGVHHDYPKDKDRLAMPPVMSITLATILLFIFKLVMGDFVFSFLPGFLVGYAMYLLVHYIVHAYPPPKNVLKKLWVNHAIHHHKDDSIIFGVSSPLWDYVFRTHK